MGKVGPKYVSTILPHDPFGMLLVGRSWSAGSEYRYGFNAKENDDEIAGNNNDLDFGSRIYDARLGRWFSIDPKIKNYTSLSPYSSFGNNPILNIDFGGNDIVIYYQNTAGQTKPLIIIKTHNLLQAITITDANLSQFNIAKIHLSC